MVMENKLWLDRVRQHKLLDRLGLDCGLPSWRHCTSIYHRDLLMLNFIKDSLLPALALDFGI